MVVVPNPTVVGLLVTDVLVVGAKAVGVAVMVGGMLIPYVPDLPPENMY